MVECAHLDLVQTVVPDSEGCEECLVATDRWVHLRICLTCGHVGCCDTSKNRHAARHSRAANHPIAASHEPGEDWAWCYVDQLMLDPA